jgi:hypothetical protein
MEFLTKYGYEVLCSADCDQTYSYDGLLVVKRGNLEHPEKISIALKCSKSHFQESVTNSE